MPYRQAASRSSRQVVGRQLMCGSVAAGRLSMGLVLGRAAGGRRMSICDEHV